MTVAVVASAGLAAGATGATAAPSTGFVTAPTDQLAVPGMLAGAEITPEGNIYTGWAEYRLRVGNHLKPWDQPTRTLPNPGQPLFLSTMTVASVRYTLSVFAVAVDGMPVAYETLTASNKSTVSTTAQAAMLLAYTGGTPTPGARGQITRTYRYERPASAQAPGLYEQPGQAFSPAFLYRADGRDLDRSGLLLARGPDETGRPLSPRGSDPLTAPHDGRRFTARLRPAASVTWTWQIPLAPPAASSDVDAALDHVPLRSARRELRSLWQAEEASAMQIDVPEAKVTATYRAALTEILMSRYDTAAGWVQASNKLQYQAVWIRDAAMETDALDLAGLHKQAAQNLQFLENFQQPDGLFISRTGQYDGLGEAMWALDQHAELTHDASFAAAELPRMQAAIGWLAGTIGADPAGLLPASSPGDDELLYGEITGDDLWVAAGLRSAIADATLAGRPDLVAPWTELDARFEASLDRAIQAAVTRSGHITPALDRAGGQDWGNYYAAYPVQVLSPTSPAVRATLAWARSHMVQGLPTYANGKSLHDYLGFAIFQTELAGGDRTDALAGLYAELTHTTSSDNGWELGISPWGPRATATDMAPHGTFAGDYVALLRNLLVREAAPDQITLLAGASPAWLAPGQHITVTAAPTSAGVISFTERSTRDGETLHWQSTISNGTMVRWALPPWARHARTAAGPVSGAAVTLQGSSGSLRITFDGHRPAASYAASVAALNSEYRAHGQPAPLRLAAE